MKKSEIKEIKEIILKEKSLPAYGSSQEWMKSNNTDTIPADIWASLYLNNMKDKAFASILRQIIFRLDNKSWNQVVSVIHKYMPETKKYVTNK